ncbi:MAG TPA: HEAT repeat domain-containing protein [Polyangiaceae bacterium]|nr:HEAT repeat domain-containing protein [Polyangiaceae bacterium]
MLRSSRTVVSLIRSLVLGTATTTTATVMVASILVGCKDESQPDFWVEKLSDAAWKARAVKRLEQFFEDAVTKNGNDVKAKDVQDLINKTVEPLTQTYVNDYDKLDSKTRVSLIKLLSAFRDKRTEPALKKAFEEFSKTPATAKDESDIKWAARATGDLKLESLAVPMVDAFTKLRASTMLGGVTYKDYSESMLDVPSKAWVGPLIARLDRELTPPGKDKNLIDPFKDELFWQTTAAQLLGVIGDPQAVEPLFRVMLDPNKGDVQATALLALVKLGKPTVDTASKLIAGKDDKLVGYAMRRIKEISGKDATGTPYVATAALVLGTSGRSDAAPALIAALGSEKDAPTKAVIARELTKVPATEESKAAFKAAYESFTLETEILPQGGALEALTEASGQFYDPSFVDWLLERAAKTKGSGDDLKAYQAGVTQTVLKLAKPDQLATVKAAVDKYGSADIEQKLYKLVEAQLKACGDRAACYVAAIQKPENQEQSTQFGGVKAGYMIGILGNDSTRDELVGVIDGINNAAVRFVAAQAIDHLTPKGSKPTSDKLGAIIAKNAKSADREKAAYDSSLKQVMYRIDARN